MPLTSLLRHAKPLKDSSGACVWFSQRITRLDVIVLYASAMFRREVHLEMLLKPPIPPMEARSVKKFRPTRDGSMSRNGMGFAASRLAR